MQTPAIVYFKPGCPFGIRLRVALRLRRIPFAAVRFRDDETGAAQVRAVNDGNEISPTVRVGDTLADQSGVARGRGGPDQESDVT